MIKKPHNKPDITGPASGTPRQRVVVIVGPTASGKSDLGIRLAKWLNTKDAQAQYGIKGAEIISADSRQVYTGMNIGTGKVQRDNNDKFPTRPNGDSSRRMTNDKKNPKSKHKTSSKEFFSGGIRHHLIDVADPKKQFTASDFKKLGEKALEDIAKSSKVPVIVGGTGFYIDILLGRSQAAEVAPDHKLRAKLEKQSAEQLFKRLAKLDPARAEKIDRHNKRRLIRALEIVMTTKKSSISSEITKNKYDIVWLGINPGKEELAKRIKKRLDERLGEGMIREVENLHRPPTGGGVSWKRLDDFGLEYRWISRWLIQIKNAKIKMQNNNTKLKKFRNSEEYKKLLTEIIKYSKRQMTWFKKNKEIRWLNKGGPAEELNLDL